MNRTLSRPAAKRARHAVSGESPGSERRYAEPAIALPLQRKLLAGIPPVPSVKVRQRYAAPAQIVTAHGVAVDLNNRAFAFDFVGNRRSRENRDERGNGDRRKVSS